MATVVVGVPLVVDFVCEFAEGKRSFGNGMLWKSCMASDNLASCRSGKPFSTGQVFPKRVSVITPPKVERK